MRSETDFAGLKPEEFSNGLVHVGIFPRVNECPKESLNKESSVCRLQASVVDEFNILDSEAAGYNKIQSYDALEKF